MDALDYVVYGLVDSAAPNDIRYVGQTQDMQRRLLLHGKDKLVCPCYFWKWGVKYFGRTYDAVVLEEIRGTRVDALACELKHIHQLHETSRLLNGHWYRQNCRNGGARQEIVEAYFAMIRIAIKGHSPLAHIAINNMGIAFPAMHLWLPCDKFGQSVGEQLMSSCQ